MFSRPGAATFFTQVAPQLTSRGWVDPVPDPLLLRKSGSAGDRTWDLCICSQKLWPLDHRDENCYMLLNVCSYIIRLGNLFTHGHVRGLDGPGIESRWGRDFPHPYRPALGPTQPPINGYRVFSVGKAAGAWCWPSTPSSAEVNEIVEL